MANLWHSYTTAMDGRAVVATMRHTWKALERRFGRMEMERITEADCVAHAADRRAAGIRDGTIHTELGHLRMVALWAQKRRLIDRAPYIARTPRASASPSQWAARPRTRSGEMTETIRVPGGEYGELVIDTNVHGTRYVWLDQEDDTVALPLTSIPTLIAALQRVAGEGEKPAPAPADDGWMTCEAGECPKDLKKGDWIKCGPKSQIIRVYSDGWVIDSGGWHVDLNHVTAYRRSAP